MDSGPVCPLCNQRVRTNEISTSINKRFRGASETNSDRSQTVSVLCLPPSLRSEASSCLCSQTRSLSRTVPNLRSHQRWTWYVGVLMMTLALCGAVREQQAVDEKFVDEYLDKFGYYLQPAEDKTSRITTSQLTQDKSSRATTSHPSKDKSSRATTSHPSEDKSSRATTYLPSAAVTEKLVPVHSSLERRKAITRLQEFFHLPTTGQLDSDTRKLMSSSRCGWRDLPAQRTAQQQLPQGAQPAGSHRVKRYKIGQYTDGTLLKWTIPQLSWRITSFSRQLPEGQQRGIVRSALDIWAQHVPIRFVEESSRESPDIDVQFATGRHGPSTDPVFDGRPIENTRGNILAHAWGPGYNPKGLAGDVHFDEEDNWKNYQTLLGVAVHELGHSMGLGHSDDQTAIMYPVYRDVVELGADDINGIRALYGTGSGGVRPIKPNTVRPQTQVTRAPPVVWPRKPEDRTQPPYYTVRPEYVPPITTERQVDLCSSVTVDAVFEDPTTLIGQTFIALSNEKVHTLTQHGLLLKSELLNDRFPGAPVNPDVAFSVAKKRTAYFIKGQTIWAYKQRHLEEDYPKSLRVFKFPETPRFSITLSDNQGNSRLILFSENYWWMFDVDRETSISYQPIDKFSRHLPPGVRFAASWSDNYLYAVTQDSYVIMDLVTRRITHEKPIPGKPQWLQSLCGQASRLSTSSATALALLVLTSWFMSLV